MLFSTEQAFKGNILRTRKSQGRVSRCEFIYSRFKFQRKIYNSKRECIYGPENVLLSIESGLN